jgi:hypothetical protein
MRGAIPPLPNMPSWCGAQFKKKAQGLYFCTVKCKGSNALSKHHSDIIPVKTIRFCLLNTASNVQTVAKLISFKTQEVSYKLCLKYEIVKIHTFLIRDHHIFIS